MKFGKRLLESLHPEWADNYIPYKNLKQILHSLTTEESADVRSDAEGAFLSSLLKSINKADLFYTAQEGDFSRRLDTLAKTLFAPKTWLIARPELGTTDEVEFASVVAALQGGVHMPVEQREALDSFVALCAEIDLLRKFAVPTRPPAQPPAHSPPLATPCPSPSCKMVLRPGR
jgi:hypothetical protein